MTQYIEHYKCNNTPAVHVEPALPIAEFDYLIGLSPPKYPVPSLLGECVISHWVVDLFEAYEHACLTVHSWYCSDPDNTLV